MYDLQFELAKLRRDELIETARLARLVGRSHRHISLARFMPRRTPRLISRMAGATER